MSDNKTINRFRELVDKEKSRDILSQKMKEKGLDCSTSTITKHYNGDRTISTEYIIKYAKYFNVSTDYLLGLSDNSILEYKTKMINEYTGLSAKSVKSLKVLFEFQKYNNDIQKNGYLDIINFIIEKISDNTELLKVFEKLVNDNFEDNECKCDIEDKIIDTSVELYKYINENAKVIYKSEYRKILINSAEKMFYSIVNDLCKNLNKQNYDLDFDFYLPNATSSIAEIEKSLLIKKESRTRRNNYKAGD